MILAHMEKSIKAQFFRTSKLGMNSTIGLRLMIVGIFCCFILPLQWTQRFQYNKLFISKAPLAAVPPFLFVVLHRSPGCRCRLALVFKTKVVLNCGL